LAAVFDLILKVWGNINFSCYEDLIGECSDLRCSI
jgi:hypothetical protein